MDVKLLEMVREVKPEQPKKAHSSMVVTLLGITREVRTESP